MYLYIKNQFLDISLLYITCILVPLPQKLVHHQLNPYIRGRSRHSSACCGCSAPVTVSAAHFHNAARQPPHLPFSPLRTRSFQAEAFKVAWSRLECMAIGIFVLAIYWIRWYARVAQ